MSETHAAPAASLHRVRMTYARRAALRYTSHLEMQMVWERTLRRAGVPLAYSKGFTPHPRLHFASALPLGFLSRCELADFWIELAEGAPAPDPAVLRQAVQAAAPPGLEILRAELVALSLPALQMLVHTAEYQALPLAPVDLAALRAAVDALLVESALPRERRGKPYDLRPLIEMLAVSEPGTDAPHGAIFMRLAAREGATGRPEEVLDALGQDANEYRVERTALILAEPAA